jgi:MFS family permease
MSSTQTETIELVENLATPNTTKPDTATPISEDNVLGGDNIPDSAVDAIPDGGYGWTVVFACSVVTFIFNGWTGSWGVLQAALLQEYPSQASTSTLSFVGSLSIALCVALGLAAVRLSQVIGARYSMLLGTLTTGCAILFSSFAVHNIGALFVTAGATLGIGTSLCYTMSNSLPMQWFGSRLGLANGLVKLGGGLGATILAVILQTLIDKVGIPWALRILGLFSLASGIPASLLIRDCTPPKRAPLVDLSLFKSIPFSCLFVAGAVGTFALFVPPFFLPLFAHSIGLSASTGAGIVSGFNACTAIGRLGAGFASDKFGSTNMLLLTMALNAISMLAIWPVANSIAPLVIFAAINGIANGSFFVTMPTAIGRIIPPGRRAVGMGMAVTGWTGGYLMGSPIAGILVASTGAENSHSVEPYRTAIFYAGGVALASAACVLAARLRMDKKLLKKM